MLAVIMVGGRGTGISDIFQMFRSRCFQIDNEKIHNKMETLLGREGAYLYAIYYCPHHLSEGFEGEIPELKMECSCR